MFKDRAFSRVMGGITMAAAMAIAVGACGAAGASHTATSGTPAVNAAAQSAAGVPATAATTLPPTTQAVTPPTPAPTPAKATTVASSAKPKVAPATTTIPAPVVTAPVATTPTLPARTQPSAAQVNSVIASVHSLFPLFTPTAAQIAQVGNEVCTAFDQGKSVAQVKTAAMQIAGVYAALIPASVVNTAVHTIVALYCPGYTSKLS